MDIVLLVITSISLGVALVMALLALRASRGERDRSAARVAALRAAADGDAVAVPVAVARVDVIAEPVAVAGTRGPAPWPPVRSSSPAAPLRVPSTVVSRTPTPAERPATTLGDGFLGTTEAASGSSGRQRSLAIAAVLLFAGALGVGYWTVFADRTSASHVTAATATGRALELMSLRHERRGAKLDVTGLVRNPAGGAPLGKLTAVVFLFDRQGAFLSSARADVDYLTLVPGDESPFVISMDAPSSVARYRVSFRNDAGVVPHVDRRGQEPIAAQTVTPAAAAVR